MSISLEQWRLKGNVFEYRSLPIFCIDEGRGESLVLIHGFPTASWDWHKIWAALSSRYRCVTMDLLGFGFSAKPYGYSYSILDQADLIEALLADRCVDKVHVLAHDYGDTVAQELLARFLDRQNNGEEGLEIRSLCLLNGGLFPETHRARFVQKLLNSPVGVVLAHLMNRRSFQSSFSAVFGPQTQPGEQELDAFWQLTSRDGGTRITHKLIKYINERRTHRDRWVGALRNASIPIRLINGPEDPVSGRHMTERYQELIRNPDIVLLDGIGHYPQVEDPTGTLLAVLEFLERVAIKSPGLPTEESPTTPGSKRPTLISNS